MNANSVSIELCDNLNKDPSSAQIKAVKKCIKYIRKYCPNATKVIRHFDVTGKHCPARMMDDKVWKKFLHDIGEK
jgi:N-acetylmuramoyl-L-alanine amidase CwlA